MEKKVTITLITISLTGIRNKPSPPRVVMGGYKKMICDTFYETSDSKVGLVLCETNSKWSQITTMAHTF